MFCKLALANKIRGYTDETHLRGLKSRSLYLVRAGGLCLCSSEFIRLISISPGE